MPTAKEFVAEFEEKHLDHFAYLYGRWQDEKEYEDFGEYIASMENHIPNLYGMTKSPFSFLVPCEEGVMRVSANSKGDSIEVRFEVKKPA